MKTPTSSTLFAALLASLLLAACVGNTVRGSGHAANETRTVPEFAALDVSGAWRVEIDIGSPQSVELVGDDNLLPLVRTETKNGALVVDSKENLVPQDELTLRIRVADLQRIESSGSSHITVRGVKNERLAVELSGAAKVNATKALDARIAGSGAVRYKGSPAEVARNVAGSGTIEPL